MQKSKEFYNNFHTKLINDYLSSDPRIIAAIEFALKNIPKNAQNILDIGCGIGWSSYEIKKHYPKANVVALDLSDFNIKTAKKLFNQDGLNYGVLDFTNPLNDNYNLIKDKKFDAIVMLDVYEHISASERSTVHNALNNLLSEEGVLLLACPSKYHQDYLRKEKPEGLQPVDEDITFNELGKLANDVGGDIISFTHANIWRYCYYSYTVIKKNHKFIRRKKISKK